MPMISAMVALLIAGPPQGALGQLRANAAKATYTSTRSAAALELCIAAAASDGQIPTVWRGENETVIAIYNGPYLNMAVSIETASQGLKVTVHTRRGYGPVNKATVEGCLQDSAYTRS
jgi:hypothetical protein